MSRKEDADRKRASNSPKTTALSVVWGSSGRLIVPRCLAGHLNSPSSVFVGCANKLHTAVILDCTNMNMYCIDMFLNTEIVYVQSFVWMFSLSVRSVESSSCGICSHDYSLWSRLKCPRLPLIEPRSRYFFCSEHPLPSYFHPPASLHVVQPKLFHHKPGAVLYVCLTLNRAAVQIVEHPLPDLWKHVLSSRRWKHSPLPLDPTCVGSLRSLPAASPAR